MGLRKGVEIQPSKNGTFQQPKQKKRPKIGVGVLFLGSVS